MRLSAICGTRAIYRRDDSSENTAKQTPITITHFNNNKPSLAPGALEEHTQGLLWAEGDQSPSEPCHGAALDA